MKIGIVGSGLVGATAAYAMVMNGIGRQIVLVDLNKERAQAEADDLYHAVPFASPLEITAGDYEDLAGCRVVIIAAGVGQRPGETRLQLLGRNATVFKQVVPAILNAAPDAILVVATNPVDIMTHLTARYAAQMGVSPDRVLGSGTMLDTARFRALLARHVGVDSRHVHAYVIGEHGDSEVLVWSMVAVGGVPLLEFCNDRGITWNDEIKAGIENRVRNAAYHIINGKGATYYGIGSALARVVDIILHDQRSILTICNPERNVAGVEDVTVAMPHMLGGNGVIGEHNPLSLTDEERSQLHHSASLIKGLITDLIEQEGA
ncbi:L-lactate dehydrogenase [Phototrophicus methaneseepsis]|uniref:L-lactate dehydrogenase n=1 Tax=Phototrophicus methaneseepsis TaxID=2710758 RepID=A0A7S8IE30_9CHLR|nr:L-lactate dehydrogenase [Phototrophicus methaneseepsis]QPC81403.1 L-lactate dehydrogenase [Phototrophicus methaneseepsis]